MIFGVKPLKPGYSKNWVLNSTGPAIQHRGAFFRFLTMPETLDKTIRPTSRPRFDDGEFFVVDDVPLFDEHESSEPIVNDEGETVGENIVHYDRRLLEIIAENNNRRIRDTDDYTPLVIGHTCDNDASHDPPVIGFAGNYRVATIGKERPRPCIFATFWVFKDCEREFRTHPRRSVEVWPEERPEDRYFDPIALLGAETPRRDLGIAYSKPRDGKSPLRYEADAGAASAPSGTNTFLPGDGGRKPKPLRNDKGSIMPLSSEDVSQITEALKPTIEAMIAQATTTPPQPDDLGVGDGLHADPTATPVDPMSGPLSDDDMGYAKGLSRKLMKYRAEDGGVDDGMYDEEGATAFMGSLDNDDQSLLDRYMKSCDDSDPAKELYSKIAGSNIADPDVDTMTGGEPSVERYRKERDTFKLRYEKLQRDHRSISAKYAKLQNEKRAADEELVELRTKERYAKRRGDLIELQTIGLAFDLDEEMQNTEDFTEDQFSRHITTTIPHRYQRAILDAPNFGVGGNGKPPGASDSKSSKYAKKATDIVMQYRKRNVEVPYAKVLENLVANDGTLNESTLGVLSAAH